MCIRTFSFTPIRQYIENTPQSFVSNYVAMPGWTKERNLEDELHDLYLGWMKDVCAQLMFDDAEHMVSLGVAPNVCEALYLQWTHYLTFYQGRASENVFTLNTLSWSSSNCYPRLPDRIKAATCPNSQLSFGPMGF